LPAVDDVVIVACQVLALLVWSWTAGFTSAILSFRTRWVQGALFCLIAFGTVHRRLPPLALPAILVLLPFLWGLRAGARPRPLGWLRAVSLAAAVVTVTVLAVWTEDWYRIALVNWSEGAYHRSFDWRGRLLPPVLMIWPVGYLLATAKWRRA
jgi:hypothetical protein